MSSVEITQFDVTSNEQAFRLYSRLMNEWTSSQGKEQEQDSDLLKAFKRFRLHFRDKDGQQLTLVSAHEFALACESIQDGEDTDDALTPWVEAAIAAHNLVKPSQPLHATTYKTLWSNADIIHDALLYAALPVYCLQEAQKQQVA